MDSKLIKQIYYHAQTQPCKEALIIDRQSYTYKDIVDSLQTMAKTLQSNAGIEKQYIHYVNNASNTIVCIETDSVYEQIILWLYSLQQGLTPIMYHRNMHEQYRAELLRLLETIHIPSNADFGVLTSGTTGMPKPLWRSESSWIDFFDEQNKVFHIDSNTKMFLHGSFSFTGNTNMILALLWAGATIVTSDKMQPKRWLSYIENYQCSHMYLLPTKLRLLIRFGRNTIDTISYIIAGSQTVDEALITSLQTMYPKMEFILYYGASELNYITYCSGHEWLRYPNTVGKPFDSVQVDIIDESIYVTTDYGICNIELPYTVGDKGYWESGYLMFKGRSGDVVNKGGYKVGVLSLENTLQNLPSIDEVAVIAVPDDIRGEEVAAFIVPKQGFTVSDIGNHIHKYVPNMEQPKYIQLVEQLPLTDCSKVDKNLLKEWYNNK